MSKHNKRSISKWFFFVLTITFLTLFAIFLFDNRFSTKNSEEMLSTIPLKQTSFIYATKNGYKSTIYKRNMKDGTESKILEFNEDAQASNSGNLWEELPPSASFSPDKTTIAFIDKDGLKTYDISNSKTTTLINELPPTQDPSEESPSEWSETGIKSTFILASPLWSPSGKHISFLESKYEGSSVGTIDIDNRKYIKFNVPSVETWSPISEQFISTLSGGYGGMGLLLYDTETKQSISLSEKSQYRYSPFKNAIYSPDGNKIAFNFYENHEATDTMLGFVNIDGSNFRVIENIHATTPFFSSDGSTLYFIQLLNGKQKIIAYDIETGTLIEKAELPTFVGFWENPIWTEDDYLSLTGNSQNSKNKNEVSRQIFILDINKGIVLYRSSELPLQTKLLHFAN